MDIINFLRDLENLAKNVYCINDTEKLNKDLQKLNEAYDILINNVNIPVMEKEYVLSKYVKHEQINMFIVPCIKNLSNILRSRYNTYHCIEENSTQILNL